MLIGRYYHTIEEKGRLSLPKTFRQENKAWVVTRGLDGGLFLFKKADFKREVEQIAQRSFTKKDNRDFLRLMTSDAHELIADKNGRVLLPEYLTKFAQLKKHVVVAGNYSRVEIWDRDLYHQYLQQLEKQAESIAEKLEIENNS